MTPNELPPASGAPTRFSVEELAIRAGVAPDRVAQLSKHGVIEQGDDGRFDAGDIHRVRLINSFEEAGVPLDALVEARSAGRISLAYYDELHPRPGALGSQRYAEFAASLGQAKEHLPRLFAAFGLAEPSPQTRLPLEDEALVRDLLDIVVATGQPDLALRTVRLFGEGARRAGDGALGTYGEAVTRADDQIEGLPIDELFDALLRPWARFARLSPTLARWLTSRHLSRAIDEYSVASTEQILEEDGFLAARLDQPPAVAFIDLTGFTRLTVERGDEVAAAIALRLGDTAAEIVRPYQGHVVKLLGDGVLARFDDATTAVEATLDLLAAMPAADLPSGHAGVASGPLISRDGDVFGRTVNMAARISDEAPDGRLYGPVTLTSALPIERFTVSPVDAVSLPGIGLTALADIQRAARPDGGGR